MNIYTETACTRRRPVDEMGLFTPLGISARDVKPQLSAAKGLIFTYQVSSNSSNILTNPSTLERGDRGVRALTWPTARLGDPGRRNSEAAEPELACTVFNS